MKRWIYAMLPVVLLAGCASGQMYPYPTSPLAEGAPVRYPLDYPICYDRPGGGTLFVPLRIRISSAGIPDPMQVMSLRKKNPADDGCFTEYHNRKPGGPVVRKKDSDYRGSPGIWQSLDMSGNGYFSAVAYKEELLNANDLREEAESRQRVAQYQVQNLARLGRTNGDVVLQDQAITINGLTWRHRVTATYKNVSDLGEISKGDLTGWDEVYEHAIDSEHVLRRSATFSSEVVADPEWIAARRTLSRKLVEAVRIEKLTQAEVDAAVAEWERLTPLERPGRRKGP